MEVNCGTAQKQQSPLWSAAVVVRNYMVEVVVGVVKKHFRRGNKAAHCLTKLSFSVSFPYILGYKIYLIALWLYVLLMPTEQIDASLLQLQIKKKKTIT